MASTHHAVSSDSPPCSPTFDLIQHSQDGVEEIDPCSLETASDEKPRSDRLYGDRPEARPDTSESQPTELARGTSRASPQDLHSIEATADSRHALESSSQDLPQANPQQNLAAAHEEPPPDVPNNQMSDTAVARTAQHTASTRQAHGISWRSSSLMLTCFVLGLLASIGHHLFYQHFSGSIVGGKNEQERNIRFACLYLRLHKSD